MGKCKIIVTQGDEQRLELCHECYNSMIATLMGVIDFKDYTRSYRVIDANGIEHEFEISKEVFFTGIKLKASELKDREYAGYRFEVYADLKITQSKVFRSYMIRCIKGYQSNI